MKEKGKKKNKDRKEQGGEVSYSEKVRGKYDFVVFKLVFSN